MDSLILGLRVLVSLGAVLGLMWLLHRRLRRGTGAPKAKALAVVARQSVGPKASVVLVDTDGQRFLLGVTEHGINVLHSSEAPAAEVITEPVVISQAAAPLSRRAARAAQNGVSATAFGRELLRQLGRQP
ncbi:flagellar biosynthetic protein FliO [Sinomonas gamaensis]|uniref:flagellar biosynthetic protein FliO n=1 Tax=Sinomonas gamaensis TaxID=2565624 RepID=UPI00110919D7|nr:flagellar biosynthetic protein FliO [Sinomonas gamaensis]